MPLAMSAGLVVHDSPIMTLPSSKVISIFSVCQYNQLYSDEGDIAGRRTAGLLSDFLVVFGLELLTV